MDLRYSCAAMICTRCDGLLLPVWLVDEEASCKAWRCSSCGNIEDDVILRHRERHMEPRGACGIDSRAPLACRVLPPEQAA